MPTSQPELTLAGRWRRAVEVHEQETFLVFEDPAERVDSWTYGEFAQAVTRVSATLRRSGVGPGDPVHLSLRNCPAFVATWLAVCELGAWMVPVDPGSTARDIAEQVKRVRPVVGICAAARSDVYRAGATDQVATIIEVEESADDLHPGSSLVNEATTSFVEEPPRPLDRLAVMFTSGTTSEPKGVVLTQANYAHVADVMAEAVGLEARHRWLVSLPLFHANAQYYCFSPAIAAGASVALTAAFSASRWPLQAHRLGATHASLFAAPIRMILAKAGQVSPRLSLAHVWFAQNITDEQYNRFAELVGCQPRQLYGMTETIAPVFANAQADPRADAIGRLLGERPVRIVDPETGADQEHGEAGLLMVGGEPGVDLFEEYLNAPALNDQAFVSRGGRTWFRTGDLISVDTDGVHTFIGRADGVIKVAGENVSLAQIETVLSGAPGLLEVAVLAREDSVRDSVPIAFAVPQFGRQPPSVESLAAWAAEHLAPSSRPREWHILDELPRTSVGKIRRFQLQDSANEPVSRAQVQTPTTRGEK